MFDTATYLHRIGYDGPLDPTLDTLRALQAAHLRTVPFENLAIHQQRPILLDEQALWDKIVAGRRGGFCYEVNGLFAALLRALGFPVTLLSAEVAREDGAWGPEFDHLTLLVQLDEPWLVDVGFGDSFGAPLRLVHALEQPAGLLYRLCREREHWTLEQRGETGSWSPQYRFTLRPRRLDDFAGMCHHHQTSPASSFTQRRICSRATPHGRVTLADMRLIITEHGQRQEQTLAGPAEWQTALRIHFGIVLDEPRRNGS